MIKPFLKSLLVLSTLLAFTATPRIGRAGNNGSADTPYQYPYTDSIDATLTSALLKSSRSFKDLSFTNLVPNRHRVPYVVGRDQVEVSFARSSKTAPLVFILTGLGGSASDGIGAFLEDHLQQSGFSVVVLPSPFQWSFALTASRSGVPGGTSDDAADIYALMQDTLQRLRQTDGIRPSRIGFLGYSMGAFEGVAVSELDERYHAVGIDRFLLINPPVDLRSGMDVLDSMADLGKTLGYDRTEALEGTAMDWASRKLQRNISDPSYFANLDKMIPFTHVEKEFLIGWLLRSCISDIAMVSQSIDDLGIFVGPANWHNLPAREAQARVMSFHSYFEKIAEPSWAARHGISPGSPRYQAELDRELSLKPHAAHLAQDSRIWLMHNADDFLLRPGDIAFLQSTFGARATIFPHGGHVGNLWYPENLRHILQVLDPLKRSSRY